MMRYKRGVWRRVFCLVLCLVLVGSELPASAKQAVVRERFIQAVPRVFAPSLGETATITFNLENRHVVNVIILDGDEVVAYLAKELCVEGGYVPRELNHKCELKKKLYKKIHNYLIFV